MRKVLSLAFGVVLAIVAGCVTKSLELLENPEFPQDRDPTTLDSGLLEKYSVGDVIVRPRMYKPGPGDYSLMVVFFSKSNTRDPSVDHVAIRVDGEPVDYDFPLGTSARDGWYGPHPREPYWISGVEGPVVTPPDGIELKNARVDLSLEVSLPEEDGKTLRKRIECHFVPYKGDYWTRYLMQYKK